MSDRDREKTPEEPTTAEAEAARQKIEAQEEAEAAVEAAKQRLAELNQQRKE